MKKFFQPASVAVIGASPRPKSLGGQIITNLLYGYHGIIYPINPNYTEICGIPCYPEIGAIPDPVDMAIVIVPAPAVPDALEACGRKGIRHVIIESAGFSEVGPEGKAIQDRCTAIAEAMGLRVWGPNCMGLLDVPRKHFFTFMHPKIYSDGLVPGRISLIVQSGMLSAGFLADLMSERVIGVGKICSIGNKSDVDECDILEYLLEDEETASVALYLESIPRGRRFIELARRAAKPIVVLKGGKSASGAKAALSHTSSLAGNARLQDSLFDLAGVTIARDFAQMMELARSLSMIPHTPPGCRTAILTYSGGAGILTCDLLEENGLALAELSPATKDALSQYYPDWLPVSNPVDLFAAFGTNNPEAYQGVFRTVAKDPQVDAIILHFFAGAHTGLEEVKWAKEAADLGGKVIVLWLYGLHRDIRDLRLRAEASGIPAHGELSRAVECLAAASRYQPRGTMPSPEAVPLSTVTPLSTVSDLVKRQRQHRIWDEFDSKRILEASGIPVVEERIVQSAAEAARASQGIGYPVVMKGLLPGEVHKTESGLIVLGVRSANEAKKNFRDLQTRMHGQGRILIQRYVPMDYEIIAGFLRDSQFGPCVMFGLGGIFSELQRDVAFALAPLAREEALGLLNRIRGQKLFRGFRGMAPLEEDFMADILVRLGELGASCPDIEQIDINPLVVSHGVPVAVDATVILKR